ncbi:hypothetical protein Dimus_012187 [Dionaea muscipula]
MVWWVSSVDLSLSSCSSLTPFKDLSPKAQTRDILSSQPSGSTALERLSWACISRHAKLLNLQYRFSTRAPSGYLTKPVSTHSDVHSMLDIASCVW